MTTDAAGAGLESLQSEHRLPLLLLSQYVFFLSRRPISESNHHYLVSRLQGLKSLAPLLAGSQNPILDQVVSQLANLHPAAFRRVAPSLQLSLIPLVNLVWPLPGNVVVEDAPPPANWLADARRALLVFGPGIGIGDELIFAPLPQWLKAENHGLQVTALSGYKGFWDRVEGVDNELQYSSHLDLHNALCGIGPFDGYDLIIFADFESPEIHRGVIAAGGRAKTFLEISLGARTAHLFDSERRWLYRLLHLDPYFANYYQAFHNQLRWLGLHPQSQDRFTQVVRRDEGKAADRLDVFVSPFTSKYDPSGVYWSRLLTGIVRSAGSLPLCLHLDTGRNWKTQRFAIELARSLAPALPSNVEVRLARNGDDPSLTLPQVYDYLERCHAVICSDSFAAHAGPLFGCLTLVLAKSELKDWRVPSDSSFYFDPESPVDEVVAAMTRLLSETLRPKSQLELSASFSQAELDLCACADELEERLQAGGEPDDAFVSLYRKFAAHHRVAAEKRREAAGDPLFRKNFDSDVRAPERDSVAGMMPHLRDQLERWQNTNFAKYVRRAARHAVPDTGRTEAAGPNRTRSTASSPPTQSSGSQLAAALLGGIQSVLREQLPSGEIATYFRFGKGALEYRRSPLLSSFVHDALGSFDLKSRWVDTSFLDVLPANAQGRFVRAAGMVRSRIRTFLSWEEGNEGGWCFRGRASGIGPDLDTTACAAAAIAQAPRRKPAARSQTHAERLLAGAALSNGNADLIARVNMLRFLALIGEPAAVIQAEVLAALRSGEIVTGSRYTSPLVLHYCVARTWAQAALPGRAAVAELLVPRILDTMSDDVLETALGLNALIDLEYWGPETIGAGQRLLEKMLPRGGWSYAPLLEDGGGAPACTAALAMTALARSGVGR
jgi:hypothetical protein